MTRVLFIGNITIDLIDGYRVRIGGSGFYGGIALSEYLGSSVHVLSSVDDAHGPMIRSALESYGIKLLKKLCTDVTTFVIEGGKAKSILKKGCVLEEEEALMALNLVKPDILLITPVINEVSIELAKNLLNSFRGTKALDIQGFVREPSTNGLACSWKEGLEELLGISTVVHGNLSEFCIGKNIIQWLSDVTSTSDSVILASRDALGCYVAYRGEVYSIPAPPVNAVDDIGAGDVLTAVTSYYIHKGLNPLDASCRGVAAASLKVENAYSSWFDLESIESIARSLSRYVVTISRK